MRDNDLIRRGDAMRIMSDGDDIVGPDYPEWFINRYATINAIPAAQPTVKPGEIERAVWGAMGWALRHAKQMPGDIIPSYTDTGNSDAEVECRRSAARILSALDMQPTVSPDVAALVKAAFQEGFLAGTADGWVNNPRIEMEWKRSRARAALARVKGVM